MTRLLTSQEIDNILDFIQPQEGIPYDTSISVVENTKKSFRKMLVGQMVYPNIIPELKSQIEQNYRSSLIQAGETVGVICAQSIGEKNTQTTLNTFHKAGQSDKQMTAGVPRFQELLNATKNPRNINHMIYLNGDNKTLKCVRDKIGHTIVGFTMKDIAKDIRVEMDKEEETWYEAYKILFDDEFSNHKHCISFKMDMKKLFEFKLSMAQIAEYIHNEYSDLHCVFSPPSEGQFDVFVDTSNITLPEIRLLFVDKDNAELIYMEEVVQCSLESKYICGIPSITEIFYLKDPDGEWFVETNSFNSKNISTHYSSFKKLLAHPEVDYTRTISNNVWDIYEVFDIEAARQFLIDEYMSIMEGINECHAMLLVDRMTHGGTIASITRYTLKKDECGPFGKASFEESLDHFMSAGAQGDTESTDGVSASIICGKRSAIGTGMSTLSVDIKNLPQQRTMPVVNKLINSFDMEDMRQNLEDIPEFVEV